MKRNIGAITIVMVGHFRPQNVIAGLCSEIFRRMSGKERPGLPGRASNQLSYHLEDYLRYFPTPTLIF